MQQSVSMNSKELRVRAVHTWSEVVEELWAKGSDGKPHLILVSPTHPKVSPTANHQPTTALSLGAAGLFPTAPTFGFSEAHRDGSQRLVLTGSNRLASFVKVLTIGKTPGMLHVDLRARFKQENPRIHFMLCSYAFVPDGKAMGRYGRPDTTFSPAIRPGNGNVVGDHFFRSPMVMAQLESLSASLMPDLDVLGKNRPMPTIMDLDCQNGVLDAPLLSYGFCEHTLAGHVYFKTDPSMTRRVPQELHLAFDILLDADTPDHAGYEKPARQMWERYGSANLRKVLPQAMPFRDYASECYEAAFNEAYGEIKLGWFEREIDGHVCGGLPSGWGMTEGWVSWQCWFNQLRSAWGLKWWGAKLNVEEWQERAEKMLNLALAAPIDRGAVPTTYQSKEGKWKGSLIAPSPDCYYDVPSMAWKGIWLLKWLEFKDCPRRAEILSQCRAMAHLMASKQNSDGSFPSWLDRKLNPVSVLDHSAQSALPAWFLFELMKKMPEEADRYRYRALHAADFLMQHVVYGQYYYDFETFFSCSPKSCIQTPSAFDSEAMRDPHTLQPPQNTLSMQWTAEALSAAAHLINPDGSIPFHTRFYEPGALQALSMMSLYQNVWPISYRKVAYTYGGFGVQNSDGEYNDARQAQFGVTLCDFGAELGRKDLFERGVAATRAAFTLINDPTHDRNGIYPNPNYPRGLQPENCGHGGTDSQDGRTGFDWGEGSALASAALLLQSYGGVYVDDVQRWAVGIDAVTCGGAGGNIESPLMSYHFPYTGLVRVDVVERCGKRKLNVLAEPKLAIRTITARQQDGILEVVAIPGWTSTTSKAPQGNFVTSTGKRLRSKLGDIGFVAPITEAELKGPISFEGSIGSKNILCSPQQVYLNPTFHFDDWRIPGWTVRGQFGELPSRSRRADFNAGGHGFIGTCEDLIGGYDDTYDGVIESPEFVVTRGAIRILVGGGGNNGTYVELLNARTNERIAVERGFNVERMTPRVWDVSPVRNIPLKIRIVDKEHGSWGHINVGTIETIDWVR